MTFVAGQVLTAAQLNALDITSLTVDTDTLVVDATNDRVGINTASPSVALDVGGSVVIDDDLTVDTSTLKVDSANNRVGIGTTSPANPLHIKEDSYGLLSLDRTANANVDQQVVLAPTWNGANNTALDFNIGSTIMRLTEAGNVGIGTTSPGGNLQVVSQNRAVTVLDHGVNNYAELGFTALGSTNPAYGVLSGYALYLQTGTSRGGLATRMFVHQSSGNVGIGTTSPTDKLDVNGNLRVRTGVDGGVEIRPWTASSSYSSIANTNHTGGEYTLLSSANATFISCGAAGSVNIRPNGNEVSGLSVQTTGTFIIAKFPGVSGYSTVRRRSSDGLLGYASSSQRYKENIVDADDTWRQIYDLRPRDFDWRESMFDTDPDGVPDDRSDYGLIAEEAHLVMPSIVEWAVPNVETEVDEHNEPIPPETPPDPIIEAVDYEKLSRYFLPAIQDLNARLTTLESA